MKTAVLGQGVMGAAVAEQLVRAGQQVVVWNRTASKCEPLLALGATSASTPQEAARQADMIIALTGTWTDLKTIFSDPEPSLAGRDVINFITTTPEEVREFERLVHGSSGRFLSGAIQGFPSDLGRKETAIVLAGDEDVWRRHESALLGLAGSSKYLGSSAALPNILDASVMGGFLIATLSGFLEALSYALRDGAELEVLRPYFRWAAERIPLGVDRMLDDIAEDRLTSPDANLGMYARSMVLYRAAYIDAGASDHAIAAHLRRMEEAVAGGDSALSLVGLVRR